MVKPNWRRAAAVVVALTAAQKAQPTKAESIRSLLSEWMDPDTGLEKTVATGKKLEAAVADRVNSWFSQAAAVVTAAPIAEDLKVAAQEEIKDVERVVRPAPTLYPYGPPPEENVFDRTWAAAANPPADPQPGFIYSRIDRTATNAVGQQVPVQSMWRYVKRDKNGLVLSSLANSKQTVTVTREELDDNYKYFYEDKDRLLVAGRKTRRARGKKRRTVKRRAKSLRRRRQ